MKERFFSACERLFGGLKAGELVLAGFSGERSDFVRFNRGKVRQAGSVEQGHVSVRLVADGRQAVASFPLSQESIDSASRTVASLRESLGNLAKDPWLLVNEAPHSSERARRGKLAPPEAIVEQAIEAARELDFVGIYAGGTIARGFASSLGQRNWHEVDSFQFDWSVYLEGDRAVKGGYAGFDWDVHAFRNAVQASALQLPFLGEAQRVLEPGEYRAYLAPAAVEEVMGMLSWGGFSARARHTRQSPLLRMQEGARLSPAITLAEDTAAGLGPAFQADGFIKPSRVPLIEEGVLREALVSPRSAKEYGLPNNAAGAGEAPESLSMEGGTLPESQALAALGDGLYIGNLWYLNYSDRPAGRMTGMTRFASFSVEGGRIAAPVAPLRFDDSIYRMLGENLADLTRERELRPSTSTYGERSTDSMRLPGALLSALRFTL